MWDWQIRHDRPRIWLDASRMAWLREKVKGKRLNELKEMAGPVSGGMGLVYLLTGDEEMGRAAIRLALFNAEQRGWASLAPVAMTYDWCHPLLTPDEEAGMRGMLAAEILRRLANRKLWRSFYFDFYRAGSDVGLSAIALAHVDAVAGYALGFLKNRLRDAMKMLDAVFPDGEWPEGFDFSHVSMGCLFRFLAALKTASGDDLMSGSAHLRNVSQYIIHAVKPNGLTYPGADNDMPFLSDRDREALLFAVHAYRDPYAQYFLNHCPVGTFSLREYNKWRDLLWYDPTVREKPLDDLPKSRIFRGQGLVLARSQWGWDESKRSNATWVSFRCGPFFSQHTHYDNNHFEIYFKGEQAIDSGLFEDDWGKERNAEVLRRSHGLNYYRRSIAHNTMLVFDPSEKSEMGVANDGGQKEILYAGGTRNEAENYDLGAPSALEDRRIGPDWVRNPGRWDTGRILAYAGNNLFTYVCGDATDAYPNSKVTRFVRHFLYVQPNLIVVFDRVTADNPTFRKTWLLHCVNEPRLRKNGPIEIVNEEGRLVLVPLLPAKAEITKVGGPGREFLIGDVNYPPLVRVPGRRPNVLREGEIPGAWRIEESPATLAEEDFFLNVLLVTDRDSHAVPETSVEAADGNETITVSAAVPRGRSVNASFAIHDALRVSICIRERSSVLFKGLMPADVVLEKGRI
jgi:hypothetical protein